MLFLTLFSLLVLAYLSWGAIYQFIMAVAGKLYRPAALDNPPLSSLPFIRVFIPARGDDAVILETAFATTQSDYPSDKLDIVVIADGLKPATVERLRALPVRVLEVVFENSTKSRSLNAAIAWAAADSRPQPEIAVILDADNAPASDFLRRMAARIQNGWQAVQGRRAAKDAVTPFSLLDAASEDMNNHFLCRGTRALGLSARLAGSGMAFRYDIFQEVMPQIDAVGGFDKELELRLTRAGVTLHYDEQAMVYDEKVARPEVFARQRSRWLAAQYHYAGQFLPQAVIALFRSGNVDFFHKALQMTLPPRLFIPVLLFGGTGIHFLVQSQLAWLWFAAFSASTIAILLALPVHYFKLLMRWSMVRQVAAAFFATLSALFGMREAQRRFYVTPKGVKI